MSFLILFVGRVGDDATWEQSFNELLQLLIIQVPKLWATLFIITMIIMIENWKNHLIAARCKYDKCYNCRLYNKVWVKNFFTCRSWWLYSQSPEVMAWGIASPEDVSIHLGQTFQREKVKLLNEVECSIFATSSKLKATLIETLETLGGRGDIEDIQRQRFK